MPAAPTRSAPVPARRPRPVAALLAALALALVASLAAAAPSPAADVSDTAWLCRPGALPNPCRESLQTTVAEPGGRTRVEDPGVAADPKVDCFYVYPTVSNQPGPTATKTREPEIDSIARFQAARFSQQCRVFAPLYRQGTLVGIFTGGFSDATRATAYADVRNAFRDYLAHDNRGRGIVLVGHSQGTGVLRQLVRREIDPDPALRRRLVGGYLLGGNVTTKVGSDRGGDFRNVPVCTRAGQAGCVVAFSTFQDAPPANTRFGRVQPGTDRLTGLPARTDTEVACVNPASIGANAESPLETLVPTGPYAPGLIAVGIQVVYGGPPPTANTPWLRPADRYTGRCERVGGAHVLRIRPVGGARHLNPYPDATWGLHLLDGNVALGDLQRALAAQIATYAQGPDAAPATAAAGRPRVRLRVAFRRGPRRCAAGPVRVRVVGPDRPRIARVDTRLNGRRAARDRRAPFATTIAARRLRDGRANRVAVRVVLRDGRSRRASTVVRGC